MKILGVMGIVATGFLPPGILFPTMLCVGGRSVAGRASPGEELHRAPTCPPRLQSGGEDGVPGQLDFLPSVALAGALLPACAHLPGALARRPPSHPASPELMASGPAGPAAPASPLQGRAFLAVWQLQTGCLGSGHRSQASAGGAGVSRGRQEPGGGMST